jgi:N-acetyl-beta-hexosaminidase
MLPAFKADVVHFGGDEVDNLNCWDQSPAVQSWAHDKGLLNSTAIRDFLQLRLQVVAAARGATSMFWQEVYDKGHSLLPSSIVDIWLSNERYVEVLKAGHRAVQSFGWVVSCRSADLCRGGGGGHYCSLLTG